MSDIHDYLCHKPRCAVMGSLHSLPWSPADTSNPCDCGLRAAVSALAALPGEPETPLTTQQQEVKARQWRERNELARTCCVESPDGRWMCLKPVGHPGKHGDDRWPAALPDTEAPIECRCGSHVYCWLHDHPMGPQGRPDTEATAPATPECPDSRTGEHCGHYKTGGVCCVCDPAPDPFTPERQLKLAEDLLDESQAALRTPMPPSLHKPTLERAIEVVKGLTDALKGPSAHVNKDRHRRDALLYAVLALEQLRDDAETRT